MGREQVIVRGLLESRWPLGVEEYDDWIFC